MITGVLRPAPRKASTGSVARGKPGWRRTKGDAGQQGDGKSEYQNQRRWQRADGQELCATEGQHQQQTRRYNRHDEPGNAAGQSQQNSFAQSLRDNLPLSGA